MPNFLLKHVTDQVPIKKTDRHPKLNQPIKPPTAPPDRRSQNFSLLNGLYRFRSQSFAILRQDPIGL